MRRLCFTQKNLQALIILLLIGIPIISIAETEVTLQWDFNDPAPEGYRVYCREEGRGYDYQDFWWQGDSSFNRCTIGGLDENATYYFVVHAFSGDDESGDSNEVRYSNGTLESLNSSDEVSAAGGSGGGSGGGGGGCFIQSLF